MSEEMRVVFQNAGCLELALECETFDPNNLTPEQAAKMKRLNKVLAQFTHKNY